MRKGFFIVGIIVWKMTHVNKNTTYLQFWVTSGAWIKLKNGRCDLHEPVKKQSNKCKVSWRRSEAEWSLFIDFLITINYKKCAL